MPDRCEGSGVLLEIAAQVKARIEEAIAGYPAKSNAITLMRVSRRVRGQVDTKTNQPSQVPFGAASRESFQGFLKRSRETLLSVDKRTMRKKLYTVQCNSIMCMYV